MTLRHPVWRRWRQRRLQMRQRRLRFVKRGCGKISRTSVIYIYAHMSVMCISINICTCICKSCTRTKTYVHVCVLQSFHIVNIFMYAYVCVYTIIYIVKTFIYAYIYIYIFIFIYTYTRILITEILYSHVTMASAEAEAVTNWEKRAAAKHLRVGHIYLWIYIDTYIYTYT